MTLADDFLRDDDQSLGADYPEAFGITFTPVISGVTLAVVGIVGAIYIFMNMVAPAQEKHKQVKTQVQEKQSQIERMKAGDLNEQLNNLNQELKAKQALRSQVIALFTNENDLDTLLLDINSFVAAKGATMINYRPDGQVVTIQDGSLGSAVNGKLKRKSIALEIEGTFSQTQALLNDLERLQPLLIVKNYSSQVSEKASVVLSANQQALIPTQATKLRTRLNIDAILPLSQQELLQAREAEENQ